MGSRLDPVDDRRARRRLSLARPDTRPRPGSSTEGDLMLASYFSASLAHAAASRGAARRGRRVVDLVRPASRRALMRRLYVISVGAAAIVGIAVGFVLHNTLMARTAQAQPPKLPALYGQATWKAGQPPGAAVRPSRPAQPARQPRVVSGPHGRVALHGLAVPERVPDRGSSARRGRPAAPRRCEAGGADRKRQRARYPVDESPMPRATGTSPPDTSGCWARARSSRRSGTRTTSPYCRRRTAASITATPSTSSTGHGDERAGFISPFAPSFLAYDLRKLRGASPART